MCESPWTILRLLEWTTRHFSEKGIASPRLNAERLLAAALDCTRLELYTRFEYVPTPDHLEVFRNYVRLRAARHPLQQILGTAQFLQLEFQVNNKVLAPRPETEILVDEVVTLARKMLAGEHRAEGSGNSWKIRILDVGTGSGCIAITLACLLPEALVSATDISQEALQVARTNAEKHECSGQVKFFHGDLFGALPEKIEAFDIITCNPPYVALEEFAGLQPEVRDFEPREALVAGSTGLEVIERLAAAAPDYLQPGGWLLMEIGCGQAEAVEAILASDGQFSDIVFKLDLQKIPRVVGARRTSG